MALSGNETQFAAFALRRRLEGFAAGSALAAIIALAAFAALLGLYARHLPPLLAGAWTLPGMAVLAAPFGVARSASDPAPDLAALARRQRLVQLVLAAGALLWAVSLPLAAALDQGRAQGAFAVIGAIVFASALVVPLAFPTVARLHTVVVGSALALSVAIHTDGRSWPVLVLIVTLMLAQLAAIERQERRFLATSRVAYRRLSSERTVTRLLDKGGHARLEPAATDSSAIEEQVRALAERDPLTGLANRQTFDRTLRGQPGDIDTGETRPAVLFLLDLDAFKAINETHGYGAGDSVLREIAVRLTRESRPNDLVARLGGDEFAVLVEAPGGDGMLIDRAHRLLAAVREPIVIEGQTSILTASVGIARAAPGGDGSDILRRASLALRAAKDLGSDRMALFDESLDRKARERRTLERELGEAIGQGQLRLHYQPLIALQSGETTGYEALVRWQHPTRGLLTPDAFLPIAEESGLIVPLGDWVIHETLAEVAEWDGDFRLALNLSPSQIRNPRFIATLERALANTEFPANRLEFEITENVLLDDANAGAALLHRLRALGVEIALDDFGTGYSSLSYLRRFRFDRVKIDRSFVRDVDSSDEARAIISATTRMAEALGMKTTAEGVERAEQLDLLRKLGCDEAQGFFILEPVEARRIEAARRAGEDFPGAQTKVGRYRHDREAVLAKPRPRHG